MSNTAFLAFAFFCALMAGGQSIGRSTRRAVQNKPECSRGAICFSGEVSAGHEFRQSLNSGLEFVLKPEWEIAIVPKRAEGNCREFASVVNPPYRAHGDLEIDTSYGWSAKEAVTASPREFRFVTNCTGYRTESGRLNIVLWPYTATQQEFEDALAKLATSPLGQGRLWITASRISGRGEARNEQLGRIEWIRFSVEVKLPR